MNFLFNFNFIRKEKNKKEIKFNMSAIYTRDPELWEFKAEDKINMCHYKGERWKEIMFEEWEKQITCLSVVGKNSFVYWCGEISKCPINEDYKNTFQFAETKYGFVSKMSSGGEHTGTCIAENSLYFDILNDYMPKEEVENLRLVNVIADNSGSGLAVQHCFIHDIKKDLLYDRSNGSWKIGDYKSFIEVWEKDGRKIHSLVSLSNKQIKDLCAMSIEKQHKEKIDKAKEDVEWDNRQIYCDTALLMNACAFYQWARLDKSIVSEDGAKFKQYLKSIHKQPRSVQIAYHEYDSELFQLYPEKRKKKSNLIIINFLNF